MLIEYRQLFLLKLEGCYNTDRQSLKTGEENRRRRGWKGVPEEADGTESRASL